jgi:hypothetical protein
VRDRLREVSIGQRDEFFARSGFSSRISPASCEDGSEVSRRRELSAVDLPVRSVWGGHVS